jgi:hypothetical protein
MDRSESDRWTKRQREKKKKIRGSNGTIERCTAGLGSLTDLFTFHFPT